MTTSIKYQTKVHFRSGRNGRKQLKSGDAPDIPFEPGRVPRVSRVVPAHPLPVLRRVSAGLQFTLQFFEKFCPAALSTTALIRLNP